MVTNDTNHLSEKLLMAVKREEPFAALTSKLKNLQLSQIQNELINDGLKKAFWINIYNAFFQILSREKHVQKSRIYTQKLINIATIKWSLDDIEHGILRRFRYKYSLGYLPNPFAPARIKKMAVSKMDYRIHFALNCGAKSCPPIAFYDANNIDQQLETATISFLESETDILPDRKRIHINRIFLWYLGDFGSKSGIRSILKENLDINTKGFKLIFKKYYWDEQLANYNNTFDQ